jgi:hypothetical protein
MAIEAVFQQLVEDFITACGTFQSLGLTVIEDRPPRDDVILVDQLGDLIDELRGSLAEGLAAAMAARDAVQHPADWYRARTALGVANALLIKLEYRFHANVATFEMLDGLTCFGRQRGGEWNGWCTSAVTAVQSCREPLHALNETELRAWQELSERLSSTPLEVRIANIEQYVSRVGPERPRAYQENATQ